MWTLQDWNKIPWQKRNEIIAFYGLRRSAPIDIVSVSYGVDSVRDDGIRESDLTGIADMSLEDIVALKPVGEEVETPPETIVDTETPDKPKRGRKSK